MGFWMKWKKETPFSFYTLHKNQLPLEVLFSTALFVSKKINLVICQWCICYQEIFISIRPNSWLKNTVLALRYSIFLVRYSIFPCSAVPLFWVFLSGLQDTPLFFLELFPLSRMGPLTRRRKGEKKALYLFIIESTGNRRSSGMNPRGASGEINLRLEHTLVKFIAKQEIPRSDSGLSRTVERAFR